MLRLVVLTGDMAGLEFPLNKDEVSLGRRSDNDVCLPTDMKLSRQHARIVRRADQLLLEDQASANGTFLRQRRIYAPTPIGPGDTFRIGGTWLEVLSLDDSATDTQAVSQVVLVGEESSEPPVEGQPKTASNIVFALDAEKPQADQADARGVQERLAILLDFGQALGSILEVRQLLRVAVDRIMNAVPAEQASLLLIDKESGEVVPKVVRRRGPELAGDEQSSGKLRISRHMVAQAIEQRLTILTSDATADARFLDAESVHELRIRSAICAPLFAHGDPIGVVYLDTSSRTHVFTESDVHLVTGIALQTAIAFENARLYTDLRTAYEDLQAAQEQLIRQQKVTTVGVLAASIAHDMANIVSPLKPLIDMLLSGRTMDDRAGPILQRQTERLLTLVQRLLAFSRSTELDLEPTDLNQTVENTLSLVRTELSHRRIELTLELADELPPVLADGAQMERALLNLVLNAADALEDSAEKSIAIVTEVEESDVLLQVRDMGPGIPEDVQQHLFEPFFTTKSTGTGLGLFSCRRIVEDEHKGRLEVDSRPGAGTKITIRLPVSGA